MSDSIAVEKTVEQKKGIWLTIATIAAVITLFMGMFFYKITSPRILSNEQLQANRAFEFDAPRIIQKFELIDKDGNPFTIEQLKGSWSLIYFGFTHCPDVCPTTLSQLSKVMGYLDPEVREKTQVIMVGVDYERDTPEKLDEYVRYFDEDFIGLAGDFHQIMAATRNFNVAFNKVPLGDDYTVDHTGHLALVNPDGHYHGFFRPPFELSALKLTFESIVYSY